MCDEFGELEWTLGKWRWTLLQGEMDMQLFVFFSFLCFFQYVLQRMLFYRAETQGPSLTMFTQVSCWDEKHCRRNVLNNISSPKCITSILYPSTATFPILGKNGLSFKNKCIVSENIFLLLAPSCLQACSFHHFKLNMLKYEAYFYGVWLWTFYSLLSAWECLLSLEFSCKFTNPEKKTEKKEKKNREKKEKKNHVKRNKKENYFNPKMFLYKIEKISHWTYVLGDYWLYAQVQMPHQETQIRY